MSSQPKGDMERKLLACIEPVTCSIMVLISFLGRRLSRMLRCPVNKVYEMKIIIVTSIAELWKQRELGALVLE